MPRVIIAMPDQLLAALDRLAAERFEGNRSLAVRELIREAARKEDACSSRQS